MTVHEALLWVSAQLLAANVGSRWLTEAERQHALRMEAETMLLWATGWSRSRLISSLSDALAVNAQTKLREVVRRRASGLPLQYATGQAAFYGRLFSVQPGCLIPRPETEVLADLAIAWIRQHRPASTVVDLGTGSGILAITIRLECPQSTAYALDLAEAALDMARENARMLGAALSPSPSPSFPPSSLLRASLSPSPPFSPSVSPSPGIEFIYTDGLRWLQESAVPFNVLVSNPPYIPSRDVGALDDEVRLYEPRLALDGGEDGLAVYRALCELGDASFAPGPAALFLEVGEGQAEHVLAMFTESATASGLTSRPGLPSESGLPSEPAAGGESRSGLPSGPEAQTDVRLRWPNWEFAVEPDLRGVGRVVWGFRKQGFGN